MEIIQIFYICRCFNISFDSYVFLTFEEDVSYFEKEKKKLLEVDKFLTIFLTIENYEKARRTKEISMEAIETIV